MGEVALAVVLVAGAGLLGRSLMRLTAVEIGIDTGDVVAMNIALPNGKYPTSNDSARLFGELLPEIEALPGIERAAVTLTEPANPFGWYNSLRIRGRTVPENEIPAISYVVVSPGYFETIGLPLIAGRSFTETDELTEARVAIINRAAARLHWPDSDPLGARIMGREDDEASWAEVIGVVDDMRQSLYEPARPEVYMPVTQDRVLSYVLMARGRGDVMQASAPVRELIIETDPDIPVTNVMSLDDRIGESTADARFSAGLMTSFAAIALVLAAVGVYGVLSYSVSLRRREFGVRSAIGATRGRVMGLVLREALVIGTVAVAVGTLGALALGRVLAGMLFEVSSRDPLTLGAVAATVASVTVVAALLPAWRAASSDPLVALRSD